MRTCPVGDIALNVMLDAADPRPGELAEALRCDAPAGLVDAIAAFDTVSIVYDPTTVTAADPIAWLAGHARRVAESLRERAVASTPVLVELPVVYGGEAGPDLAALAGSLGVSVAGLIERHAGQTYTVAAIGFLPGFAYLDGLPSGLHAARRSTPRVRVPAGTVAIGGPYTGVYPVESPGGWHLIGRTPQRLFDPADPAAMPWRVGDRVKFLPVRS